MNSSSEPHQSAAYPRMEYCEAGEAGQPFEGQQRSQEAAEPKSDAAEIFAARMEEMKRTIKAQSRSEAMCEIQLARHAMTQTIEEFARQRQEYFRQVEAEVVQLALAIARRIIHRESQIDPSLLAALVRYELEQLDATTSVRLIVAPDALSYWNEAAAAMPRTVEVTAEKKLPSSNVRIETELAATSINFDRELKEIESGFFDLLALRPMGEQPHAPSVQ